MPELSGAAILTSDVCLLQGGKRFRLGLMQSGAARAPSRPSNRLGLENAAASSLRAFLWVIHVRGHEGSV